MKENSMNEEETEKLKDLKAVYSGAIQSGEIGIANMIKGGIDLIEKLQKENKELKNSLSWRINYCQELEKDLFENCSNYVIPIQKVKDKISERQFELQQEYKDFEDDAILIVLQELLEGRKQNV